MLLRKTKRGAKRLGEVAGRAVSGMIHDDRRVLGGAALRPSHTPTATGAARSACTNPATARTSSAKSPLALLRTAFDQPLGNQGRSERVDLPSLSLRATARQVRVERLRRSEASSSHLPRRA